MFFDGAYETAGVLSGNGEITDSGLSVVRDYKKVDPGIELLNIYGKNRLITLAKEDRKTMIVKGGANMDDKKLDKKVTDEKLESEVKKVEEPEKDTFVLKATEVLGKSWRLTKF